MILRPYQRDLYRRVREAFRTNDAVFMQLPTGGGKTIIFASMTASAHAKGRIVWDCLPRQELIDQTSDALSALGVPHGRIAAGYQESKAFHVHLVSSNTLIRRYDKIKTKPDFIILDEAHLFYDRQLEIRERYPDAKILGVSASPERLDGRGLSDIYDTLIEGPPIAELIELGYLAPVRYYAPPIEGLETVRRRGFDYNADELEQLFQERKVYGSAVDHYRTHAPGKTALVFARSVEAAEKAASEFRAAGYRFEPISGKMGTKKRAALIGGLRSGELHGLVNCEIATYGLDVPRIECLIMLRPTTSKALQVQMIGRGLRVSHETGKQECIVLDHVGLLQEFGHPLQPHEWEFDGHEKRKRKPVDTRLKLCPETFLYCVKPSCVGCPSNTQERKSKAERVVDCELAEVTSPVKLRDRATEERQEYTDRLGAATAAARKAIDAGDMELAAGPIGELLSLARAVGRREMWVYWLLSDGRVSVNVSLLAEIARQRGYKPGWTWFQRKEIEKKLKRKAG